MIRYFLAKSLKGFGEHIYLNAVSTGVITVIFIIFFTYLLILLNLNRTLGNMAGNLQIYVYMKKNAPAEQIAAMKQEILTMNKIKNVIEYSSNDSLAQFRSLFRREIQDFSNIGNPFPIYFALILKRIVPREEIRDIVARINNLKEAPTTIDEIDSGSNWIEHMFTAFQTFKRAGLVFLAILFSGLFMIVFNTIRLIFVSRSRELEVMRIMGATNTFIIIPFLMETFISGLISISASLTILYSFWFYLQEELSGVSFLLSGFIFFRTVEIAIFIATGTFLVMIAAFLSLHRSLKEIL